MVPGGSWMTVTQFCVSGRLFVLVPAQNGRVDDTTEPKLFLQGTSKLQWEAVIAAWTGLAQLSLAVVDCPGIYWRFPAISAPCWCSSCRLWYPSWQLKVSWAVSLGVQSPHQTTVGTTPLCPYRQSAKTNTSQTLLSLLGNISVAVWRRFLIFKWFNLCKVKLHGNNLSDSGFPGSNELQPCNWFSFNSDKVQCLVTLTHMDMTGLTGSSFFSSFFPTAKLKKWPLWSFTAIWAKSYLENTEKCKKSDSLSDYQHNC